MRQRGIQIRFGGPPGGKEAPRFVDAEDLSGESIRGRWEDQGDGTWLLVFDGPVLQGYLRRLIAVQRPSESPPQGGTGTMAPDGVLDPTSLAVKIAAENQAEIERLKLALGFGGTAVRERALDEPGVVREFRGRGGAWRLVATGAGYELQEMVDSGVAWERVQPAAAFGLLASLLHRVDSPDVDEVTP